MWSREVKAKKRWFVLLAQVKPTSIELVLHKKPFKKSNHCKIKCRLSLSKCIMFLKKSKNCLKSVLAMLGFRLSLFFQTLSIRLIITFVKALNIIPVTWRKCFNAAARKITFSAKRLRKLKKVGIKTTFDLSQWEIR